MKTVSLGIMIEQIDGLRDTKDLTAWENDFVASIVEQYLPANKDTRCFSGKQMEVIERLWRKHFIGYPRNYILLRYCPSPQTAHS